MNKKNFFKYVRDVINDPKREFDERVFIILTIISEITVFIAFIADIIMHEYIGELITLTIVLVAIPTITFGCLYINKLKLAMRIIVISLVFLILPALFYFGGGMYAGGFVWTIFAFIYVGLVMSGRWRKVILVCISLEALGCLHLQVYHPDLIAIHEQEMNNIDAFLSIILVGVVCFVMTWFQSNMFKKENERARKAAEEAEELTRAQNRFFSSMSHEIRTPINSILGLNELTLRDESISDDVARNAGGIQGAGKLLLSLINDILDFSKMEAGSMDIVPVDYRIGDLLSEIVNMIWLKAHDKGLRFDVSIDPKVPSVLYGDEVRIKQIIINLLNNAVKYTQEGSIELHVESESTDEKETTLSISVSDTGMGIKKEALPYLFDAFKRVDEEKNRHIEGTGLGLSIVKQLAELMGGTVVVNSVYGEGSTFTFTVKQNVSDSTEIGQLNIHNQAVARSKYEASFTAPDARVLIVDDNEMNLEVEKRLLSDTQMVVDTAISGRLALEYTNQVHYDAILMDHLMPAMDGIDCLKVIRSQSGGLNRTTPVIVLTANAGSQNRELYKRSGFDGYLVKPVSGEALEDMLVKHISKDKLVVSGKMMRMKEDINAAAGYARKLPVIITATSMSDIPENIIKKLNIPIIPFLIHTENGTFKDGVQMESNELIRYMSTGKSAVSSPPDVRAFTDFFAGVMRKAHHVIHISLTTSMSDDYDRALEAAKSFDNVTVVNSGCLSSSTGLLVLIACKLAQQNYPVEEIVAELEAVKSRLRCSFVVDKTEFLAKKNKISPMLHSIAKTINLHPCLKFTDDKAGFGGAWVGSTKRAYRKYIQKAFPVDIIPDSDVVFITYADVPIETLNWIKEEISRIAYFERVVFKQASAGISSNCGPGTFGILYFVKSNKSYNIGSFIDDEERAEIEAETDDEEDNTPVVVKPVEAEETTETGAVTGSEAATGSSESQNNAPWYMNIKGLDGNEAIKNSGSEDAFKTVLKIFYESMAAKSSELDGFFSSEDWQNYTIKIHAMKSSAKLIGAMELSDKAFKLEMAGKEGNIDYIRENHADFMKDFSEFKEPLSDVFEDKSAKEEGKADKPIADSFLMDSVYESLQEAADAMDCDAFDEVFKELDEYALSEADEEKIKAIREKADNFDYEGVLEILNGNNNQD